MRAHGTRALAVIDYAEHSRGGHFGPYLIWIVREFACRFERVLLFTPHPRGTRLLFQSKGGSIPGNISFQVLPPGPRKRFWRLKRRQCPLVTVAEKAHEVVNGQTLAAFIMWGYDLLEPGVAGANGVPWATMGSNSYSARGHLDLTAQKELQLEALCGGDPDCRSLLLLDKYVVSADVQKAQWLPGYENVELPMGGSAIVQTIRGFAGGRFCVGMLGNLTGPRGVNEVLELAQRQPEIRFVLVGRLFDFTVRKDLQPLLKTGALKNVLMVPGFLKDERELNAAVQAVDSVLLDGRNQPSHSGILTKALFHRKFLLTPECHSWVADVIGEFGTGLSYPDPRVDFVAAWQAWQQNGGPERSRKAAMRMMDPEAISSCFDELARRLGGSVKDAK
jgi:hypothetical protein